MSTAIVMPQLGLTMEEGTVSKWLKSPGEAIKKDEALFSVATDKVEMDVECSVAGTLGEIVVPEGETVRVGTVVAYVVEEGKSAEPASPGKRIELGKASGGRSAPQASQAPPHAEKAAVGLSGRQRVASPRAKRLAKELGIELERVVGSGVGGQITEQDVRRTSGDRTKSTQSDAGRRQLIAERLTRSIQTIPTFSVAAEVNAEALLDLYESLKQSLAETTRLKLTVTDLLLAVFARMLKASPDLNAVWDNNSVRVQGAVDIGLAVATDKGVIAPVLRNLDSMELSRLVATRAEMVGKTRNNRLSLADLEGGVSTLTNLGMYRVDHFQAIINPAQSSILAVGQIRKRPWADQQLTIKPTMMLNLSVDHRVADGAVAAVFLEKMIELIENPRDLQSSPLAASGNGRRSNA